MTRIILMAVFTITLLLTTLPISISLTVIAKTAIERQQEIYAIVMADVQERNRNMSKHGIEPVKFIVEPIEATKKIFEKETFEAVEYTPEQIHNEITNMFLKSYAEKQREEPSLADAISSFAD